MFWGALAPTPRGWAYSVRPPPRWILAAASPPASSFGPGPGLLPGLPLPLQARLPLLSLPEDLREALEEGSIPYTAALELKKVKDEGLRKALLEEARAGLSLRDLKARVREALKREKAPKPWHREVGERLMRLDLEALPPDRRAQVERLLEELEEVLREE